MIVVWGSCLAITLLSVSGVVRRGVQPLDQLKTNTHFQMSLTVAS